MKKIIITSIILLSMFLVSNIAFSETGNNGVTSSASSQNQAEFNFHGGTRGFGIAPEMSYPTLGNYFMKPTNTWEFMSMKEFVSSENVWTESMSKGMWTDDYKVSYEINHIVKVNEKPKDVKFVFKRPKNKQLIAIGTFYTKVEDQSSNALIGKCLKKNFEEIYATNIYVSGEGVRRVLDAWSMSVGLLTSGSVIETSQKSSGIGTIGFGYTTGEAGAKHKPWLRVLYYK